MFFVNAQYCLEYDFFGATVPKFDAKKSAGLLPMFVRKEEDLLNAKLVRFSELLLFLISCASFC